MAPNETLERRRRHHDKKLKTKFEQLLRLEFEVIFDVDVILDEDSVEITLIDND